MAGKARRGDYVEIACYDTSHCRQGTALVRLDRLAEKGTRGQWAEASFIAVSDEHLRWWLDSGEGQADAWQFEVHFCPTGQRGCREGRRGRGKDFHTDRFRVVTVGDLSGKKVDWLKASPSKKYVEEELQRLSDLPTGKAADDGGGGAGGLSFDDQHLPPADPSEGHEALKGLTELEKEIGRGRQARKRQGTPERERAPTGEEPQEAEKEKKKLKKKKRKKNEDATAQGRATSAPASPKDKGWFGQPAREPGGELIVELRVVEYPGEEEKEKEREEPGERLERQGPLWGWCQDGLWRWRPGFRRLLRGQPAFSRRPPLRRSQPAADAARVRPAKAGAAGIQTSAENAGNGREGGGAVDNLEDGEQDTASGNQLDAHNDGAEAAADPPPTGDAHPGPGRDRSRYAADVLAQRLKALELFQSDGGWNRAQYLELLDAEGPSLLGRDEAVMASKEWAGELWMRRLQTKGGGKGDPK